MIREQLREGERAAAISTLATLVLASLKGFVGILSGSVALTADAIHSLTDVVTAFSVFIGLRLSQRKPDDVFKYGYYKAETMASLLVALMVLLAGVGLLMESYNNLFREKILVFVPYALAASLVSTIVDYALYVYKRRVGLRVNSHALIAESENSKSDVLTSLLVFGGIFFSYIGLPKIEPLIGSVVSLLIIWVGLKILKDSSFTLMDACTRPELGRKVSQILKGVEGVRDVKDVRLRGSGPFIFGEAKVEMKGNVTVLKAHEQSDKMEEKIKQHIPELESFIIHIEPSKSNKNRIAIPVAEDNGIESRLAEHFGKAPFFMFLDLEDKKVIRSKVNENPGAKLEHKNGMAVAKFLIKNKIDTVIASEIGEGAYYALKDHVVEAYIARGATVNEVIKRFSAGRLKRMEVG